MNKLNRLLQLAGVELTERQAPPKSDDVPNKKPSVEVKKIGTDQPKTKMNRNMAETMIGNALNKYIKNLEDGKRKVAELAAHILTISDAEIKTLLAKFKVSKNDEQEIISLVNKTK